jgi:predicted GH43/DUF377 family glycosyl hydrolase
MEQRTAGRVHELFERSPANPVLTPANWPYAVNAVFNPGVAAIDGETVLLCRVEDRCGISHLTVARSADRFTGWRVDPAPLILADPDDPVTQWGVEDPRITWVAELGAWFITYTGYGPEGPCVVMAQTDDFRSVQPLGVAMPPEDKNASLLPRRVGGRFVLFHRPSSALSRHADIWLSYSADLKSWTRHVPVLRARQGAWWDSARIGMGPPPLETEHGWLCVYHGVKEMVGGPVYRVGVALLNLEEPARVLARGQGWVLAPSAEYERVGDAPNVVFPCGLLHDPGTGELRLYYGAADTVVAVATATLSDVLQSLDRAQPG